MVDKSHRSFYYHSDHRHRFGKDFGTSDCNGFGGNDPGLVPAEMANRIVSIFERSLTTSVNNIEHIESQSLNGVSVVKVFLQLNANVDGAISEIIAEAPNRHSSNFPRHHATRWF